MTFRAVRVAAVPLLCATALAVSGCGGLAGDQPPEETSTSGTPAPASELVGLWRVQAEGLEEDTWVQLGSTRSPASVTVWTHACTQSGMWRARAGTLVAQLGGWSSDCDNPAQPWLEDASGYADSGDGMVLLDAAGDQTAQLTIDGVPPPNPNIADEYREQPELTEEQRADLDAAPAPRPDGVIPASFEELLGRWVPTEPYPTDPYLELAEDGTWTGSDGCNGVGGRWALAADGSVLTIAGAQTLVGCEGHNFSGSLAAVTWLVVEEDTLLFYGDDGELLDEGIRT